MPGNGIGEPEPLCEHERDEEKCDRQDGRVDRVSTLLRPVDVAEVEDERELVEHERRADAEDRSRRRYARLGRSR